MSKLKAWRQRKNMHLLALEDPQQPGVDIGSGCFNILEASSVVALSTYWPGQLLSAVSPRHKRFSGWDSTEITLFHV